MGRNCVHLGIASQARDGARIVILNEVKNLFICREDPSQARDDGPIRHCEPPLLGLHKSWIHLKGARQSALLFSAIAEDMFQKLCYFVLTRSLKADCHDPLPIMECRSIHYQRQRVSQ